MLAETANRVSSLERGFFGRRKGRPLSPTQQNLLTELYPTLAINCTELRQNFHKIAIAKQKHSNNNRDVLRELLFPDSPTISKLHLEIGFGGGEFLVSQAKNQLNTGFLGVEPFVNSIIKLLHQCKINPELKQNIRLYNDDAATLLQNLPDNSIDGLDIFYPDPWPKKKHHKRRFIRPKNLSQIIRVLQNNSSFRFASDIPDYVMWVIELCQKYPELNLCKEKPISHPFDNWVSTRYEQKALREGRKGFYLEYKLRKF